MWNQVAKTLLIQLIINHYPLEELLLLRKQDIVVDPKSQTLIILKKSDQDQMHIELENELLLNYIVKITESKSNEEFLFLES